MSVPVDPLDLEQHTLGRPFAYVITMSSRGAHVIAIRIEITQGYVDCSRVGHSTRRNIGDNPAVTIVWPPAPGDDEYGLYSLVVDGVAHVNHDKVLVQIESAVLHRPA